MDYPTAWLSILQSFSISQAEVRVYWNICHTQAYWESLLWQKAEAEDTVVFAMVIHHRTKQLEEILEKKQAHRAQLSVLFHLQLQQQEQVESNNKELRWSSALVEQH